MKIHNMGFIISMVFVMLFITACQTGQEIAKENEEPLESEYMVISPRAAKEKLANEDDIFLIDIRTPGEYQEGHIKDSILVPLDEIREMIEDVVPDKGSKIIIYCRSGNRTKAASRELKDMGYRYVYDMGGIISAGEIFDIE